MQWVRALIGGEIGESLASQVRDPADGKMYLFRHIVCQYDDDVEYAIKQVVAFSSNVQLLVIKLTSLVPYSYQSSRMRCTDVITS